MYNFIIEQTNTVKSSDINIIAETKIEGTPNNKVVFEAVLQSANVINNNRRIYDGAICESIVSQLSPKAESRNLLMEIDHPLFGLSADELKRRAGIIEIKNCGAVLRKVKMKGKDIIGEIETLSGFKGPDLANLILKDKVDIGFSLRALGSVEPLSDGTLQVKAPIRPVTYDVVSNPSHSNAKVQQFLPETDLSFIPENCIICEGDELRILEADQIHVCDGNNCTIKFLDDIINEQYKHIIHKGIILKF